jgi:putative DNA primase/helicase
MSVSLKSLQQEIPAAPNEKSTQGPAKGTGNSGDDETITRLAALSLLEYDRIRKDEAKRIGCREPTLDSLVNAKRLLLRPPGESDNLQGAAVQLADVELWPEAVDGAEVLAAIAGSFSRYVVLPDGAVVVLPLWCAHTHVYNAFQCSPRLNACSPEKQCGKTTLRDVAALFVPRPILTENMTTAVLFRLAAAQSPTILADECDGWIAGNEELKSLFNSGHRKGGIVMRCEGDQNELRAFATYTPAMLCGIGSLPSTLHDRSIVIQLERAKRGEIKARFDSRHVEGEIDLCRKLARWCNDNREAIEACDPKLPETAFNRVADNWRPLFAIAEIAGSDWPQRCADAFAKLTSSNADADSVRVELLTDIRKVFAGEWPSPPDGQDPLPIDRAFSRTLVETLCGMTERPWPEVNRGKPITERWLARNLTAFGIKSGNTRIDEKQAKGYERSVFEDTFARYLPETGNLSVPPSHT